MSGGIRQYRVRAGLQQRDLATALGVQAGLLSQWERGLASPDDRQFVGLARALDVPADAIRAAHEDYVAKATPGEGYTTSRAGDGGVTEPRSPMPVKARRVLDLFCGSGGLSYGFEQSGRFKTAAGIDLLQDRVDTFLANHEHAIGIVGDLRMFPLDRLAALTGKVDVIVGGPPCQGFSSIRPFRTLTEGDPRNSLPEHYVLVVARLLPTWFVFENVVGIVTHERGKQLEGIVARMAEIGYHVEWRVMNAALFGVPQNRERVVIVGNRSGLKFAWPTPTHWIDYKSMAGTREEVVRPDRRTASRLPRALTVMDAIGDLPPVRAGEEAERYAGLPLNAYQKLMRRDVQSLTLHKATRHSEKMLEIIRHAGANINALPKGMVTSGFSSCYSRLDGDKPSTTLTVNFVHPASNRCIHPKQDRALTPREGARLQSFPDRFVFCGTSAQIVKQIGNAVPPMLGQVLAEAIVASEEKRTVAEDVSRNIQLRLAVGD